MAVSTFVRKNRVAEILKDDQVMSKAEYSEAKNMLERLELDYQGQSDQGIKVIQEKDPDMYRQIIDLKATLAKYAPKEYKDAEKNELNKFKKELERQITTNMPTENDLWKVPGRHGTRAEIAIDKHVGWESKNAHKIELYQKICRILEPEDPNAGSVERLRKDA